jgi:hypothetical protein
MATGVVIASAQKRSDKGLVIMLAGCGGIFGYFFVAGAIFMLDRLGLRALTIALPITVALALASTIVLGGSRLYKRNPQSGLTTSWKPSANGTLIFLPLLSLWLVNAYNQIFLPAFAWDTLSWWGLIADRFIEAHVTEGSGQIPFPYESYSYSSVQPITNSLIAAYSGYISSIWESQIGIFWPWFMAWLLTSLIVLGFTLFLSGSFAFACATAYVLASLPLLENHMLAAGYAEIWVAAAIAVATTMIVVGIIRGSKAYGVAGVLIALIPLALKNTGAAYAGATIGAFLIVVAFRYSRQASVLLTVGTALVLFWVSQYGFDLTVAGSRFALETGDRRVLYFAGRVWTFELYPLGEVLWNEFYALFVNSSFSLLTTFFLVSMVISYAALDNTDKRTKVRWEAARDFVLVSVCLHIGALLSSQIFFEYGFTHATPSGDTGNSRFTLPAAVLMVLFIGLASRQLLREGRRESG